MILSNTTKAAEFLPSLNLSVDNTRFNDFFRGAQEWLVCHIIGEDIEDVLEEAIPEGQEDQHLDLRTHCQRVIAEIALLKVVPEMDMQLTEAGFAVQNNDNFSPASSQRVDRLIAKMPERIASDVDALVRFLMKNSIDDGAYGDWRDSEQFKYLTSAFIPLCEVFTAYCSGLQPDKKPSMKYDDFYASIPLMARELRNVADYYVSRAEIDRLLGMYRDNSLQEIHRKAIVCLEDCAVAALRYNMAHARNAAVCARDIMLDNLGDFPAFAASPASSRKDISIDGGKTVNFL